MSVFRIAMVMTGVVTALVGTGAGFLVLTDMDFHVTAHGTVEPARAMNAVCIRTHTAPIPKWWLDVCDEEGLLVLLEFAVTVNCANLRFDEREFAAFAGNLQNEAAAPRRGRTAPPPGALV